MGTPGPLELAIVLVIVLLIFGPKRLPGLGRQLGSGMREFKDSITGKAGRDDDEDEESERPTLTAAHAETPPPSEEPSRPVTAEDAPRS
jgi:sec-independent protein translocase protein TatA